MPTCMLSHVQLFVKLRIVILQAPLSMGFLRQEYRSGLPFPSSGDLLDPGIEPTYPALQALSHWGTRELSLYTPNVKYNHSMWICLVSGHGLPQKGHGLG